MEDPDEEYEVESLTVQAMDDGYDGDCAEVDQEHAYSCAERVGTHSPTNVMTIKGGKLVTILVTLRRLAVP
jgi:hypothetical protein